MSQTVLGMSRRNE